MYGTLISSVTVGAGGVANITFSSIPQTYTDLIFVMSGRVTSTSGGPAIITFNGSGTGYTGKDLLGNGSTAASYNETSLFAYSSISTDTASTFGNAIITIPNYTGATNKTVSIESATENNGSTAQLLLHAGVWANTAAITSVTFDPVSSGLFDQYSTIYMYGLLKGSGGATAA